MALIVSSVKLAPVAAANAACDTNSALVIRRRSETDGVVIVGTIPRVGADILGV
jgi:hypothetical protein